MALFWSECHSATLKLFSVHPCCLCCEAWDWYLQWTDNNNKYLASQIHNHKHISSDEGRPLYLGGNIHTVNKQLREASKKKNCIFWDNVSIDFTRPPLKPNWDNFNWDNFSSCWPLPPVFAIETYYFFNLNQYFSISQN